MSTETVRPDATVSNGNSTPSAGTRHACLSDDSDTTYVTLTGSTPMVIGFGEPSIPAGAEVTKLVVRARTALDSILGSHLVTSLTPSAANSDVAVSWSTPTTHSPLVVQYDQTPSNIEVSLGRSVFLSSNLRVYELYVDVEYVEPPTVEATAPTGTITNTNLPTVEWESEYAGLPWFGFAFEAKIFTAAQAGIVGFDPGEDPYTVSSGVVVAPTAPSWTDTTTLLPNGDYEAYVRIANRLPNGDLLWSDWDGTSFEIDAFQPDPPELTATAEPDEGRVRLEVDTSALLVQVERSVDQVTWESIRLRDKGDYLGITHLTGDKVLWDFEAPNGVEVFYRARILDTDTDTGATGVSDWATDSATWSGDSAWLKHPTEPGRNFPIQINSLSGRKRAASQGTFKPFGRKYPVVIEDVRAGDTGEVKFDLPIDERALLDDLLDSTGPYLLQPPPNSNEPDRYVFFGDLDDPRSIDRSYAQATLPSLPWTQVERPDGELDAWPDES